MRGREFWRYRKGRVSIIFMEKISEQRLERNDKASGEDIWRKIVPGRRHSRYKGPEIEVSLVYLKSYKEAVWPWMGGSGG